MTDHADSSSSEQSDAAATNVSSSGSSQDTAYRVLARKYRPSNFDELIGQDSLVQTLSNALKMGRLAHAFVLTGLRGIGKTTTARIIARGLNCTSADGQGEPTLTPCGVCSSCTGIAEGRHVDVIEMDAASNTGVDDVREIIDGVGYRPLSARYKIYIIDEVHMLSKNAFNALLKTLEEPPEAVKFIFATTEIRKVPVTVLSRCQRFDLRRVPNSMMAAHLKSICAQENIASDDAAIERLARAAEGSVRDGLSLLDQAAALTADQISDDAVASMLGQAGRGQSLDMVSMALAGDAAGAMERLGQAVGRGAEPLMVINDMLDLLHMATRLAAGGHLDDAPEGERDQLTALAENAGIAKLGRAWQITLKGHGEVSSSPNPHAAADMVLIRLAHVAPMPTPADLVKKLEQIPPNAISGGMSGGMTRPVSTGRPGSSSTPSAEAASDPDPEPEPAPASIVAPEPEPQPEPEPVSPEPMASPSIHQSQAPQSQAPLSMPNDLNELVTLFENQGELILANQIRLNLKIARFDEGVIEYDQSSQITENTITEINRLLHQWTAVKWVITPTEATGGRTLDQRDQDQKQAEIAAISTHPLVAATLERFPGATVTSITPIDSLEPAPPETDGPETDGLETDLGVMHLNDDNQGGPPYA